MDLSSPKSPHESVFPNGSMGMSPQRISMALLSPLVPHGPVIPTESPWICSPQNISMELR